MPTPMFDTICLTQLDFMTIKQKMQTSYTDKPNANLSFTRLINQEKDIYKTRDAIDSYDYKALILVERIDAYRDCIIIDFLNEWITEKRSLYCFYQNQAFKINTVSELTMHLAFLNNCVKPSTIYEKLAEINIAADDITILNSYKLNELAHLIKANNHVARELALSTLKDSHYISLHSVLKSGFTLQDVTQSLTERDGCLDFNKVDVSSEKAKKAIKTFIETDVFDTININENELQAICEALRSSPKMLKIKKIKIHNIHIASDDFIFLLEHCPHFNALDIDFWSEKPINADSKIHQYIPNIKSLSIHTLTEIEGMNNLFSTCKLEELKLTALTPSDVEKLKEDYLESAIRNDGSAEDELDTSISYFDVFIQSLHLNKLTKMYWQDGSCDLNILETATELTQLTITAASFTSITSNTSFPKLSALTCNLTTESEDNISLLLTKTQNVTLLDLNTICYLSREVDTDIQTLLPRNIRKLNVATKEFHGSGFAYSTTLLTDYLITSSSKTLTHLKMVFANEKDLDLGDGALPKLEYLYLIRILPDDTESISNSAVASFLVNTPNLQSFHYDGSDQEGPTEDEEDSVLEALELRKLRHVSTSYYPGHLLLTRLLCMPSSLESFVPNIDGENDILEDRSDYINNNIITQQEKILKVKYLDLTQCGKDYIKCISKIISTDHLKINNFVVDQIQEIAVYDTLTIEDKYGIALHVLPLLHPKSQLKHLNLENIYINLDRDALGYENVQSLTLTTCEAYDRNSLVLFLRKFPALKCLTIKDLICELENTNNELPFNLNSVTSISITSGKMEYEIIQSAPHLEYLNILTGTPLYTSKIRKIINSHRSLKNLALPVFDNDSKEYDDTKSLSPLKNKYNNLNIVGNIVTPEESTPSDNNDDDDEPDQLFSLEEQGKYSPLEFFIPKKNSPIGTTNYRISTHTEKATIANKQLIFKLDKKRTVTLLSAQEQSAMSAQSKLFEKYKNDYESSNDVHYGKFSLTLFDNDYVNLPSISPQDEILHIKTSAPIQLAHSKETGFYAIKLLSGYEDDIDIEIIIKTHFHTLSFDGSKDTYGALGKKIVESFHFSLVQTNLPTPPPLVNNLAFPTEPSVDLDRYFLDKNMSDDELEYNQEDLLEEKPETIISDESEDEAEDEAIYELSLKIDIVKLDSYIKTLMQQTVASGYSRGETSRLFNKNGLNSANYNIYLTLMKVLYVYLNTFEIGALSEHENTADNLLNTLIKDHKGACRHRSFLFKAITDSLNLPCRLITNTCHAYIEIPKDETLTQWVTLDLGGYPAIIENQPTYLNKAQMQKRKAINETKEQSHDIQADGDTSFSINIPNRNDNEPNVKDDDFDIIIDSINDEDMLEELPSIPTTSEQHPSGNASSESMLDSSTNSFVTWKYNQSTENTFQLYWQSLKNTIQTLKPGAQNILITVPNHTLLEKLSLSIIAHQKQLNGNAHYISSLDDIQFTAATVQNGQYSVRPSELVEYLKPTISASPNILIVNWTDHKPKHIGFNTLVDSDIRRLANHPIPDNMIVIVLITDDKAKSLREDFYSRFRIKSHIPLELTFTLPEHSPINNELPISSVDLMGNDDWKNQLIGSIALEGHEITAKKGAIINVLQSNTKQLVLHNLPNYETKTINAFLNEMLIKRSIYFNSIKYDIPLDFVISITDKPYTFEGNYNVSITTADNLHTCDWVLNSETYESFFNIYTYGDSNVLSTSSLCELAMLPGRISEATRQQTLSLLVTSELSDGEWARLIAHANTTGTLLHIITNELNLPKEMLVKPTEVPLPEPIVETTVESAASREIIPTIETIEEVELQAVEIDEPAAANNDSAISTIDFNVSTLNKVSYFTCNDIHYVIDNLVHTLEPLQFTVTPEMGYEIIENASFKTENQTGRIQTEYALGALSSALLNGQTVILKIASGMLSRALASSLETLFLPNPFLVLKGVKRHFPGKLIICSQSSDYFSLFQHKIAVDTPLSQQIERLRTATNTEVIDKLMVVLTALHLQLSYTQIKTFIQRNTKVSLETILPFVLGHKNYDQVKKELSDYFKQEVSPVIPALCTPMELDGEPEAPIQAEAKQEPTLNEFDAKAKMINTWLSHDPCLFLMGPTGSGKSTIILQTLPTYLNNLADSRLSTLFVGLEKLTDWAKSPADNLNILFIDEANLLAESAIQLFDDLYNKDPGIMIHHNYVKLSANHKVIFAGNMSHYVGRVQHELADRHGLYVELPGISKQTLINTFIKPNIDLTAYIDEQEALLNLISDTALTTYHFINDKTDAVFTPRNLKNISLRFELMRKSKDDKNCIPEMIWLACYDELRYLVNTETKHRFRALMLESIKPADYIALKKYFVEQAAKNIILLNYAETHAKSRRLIHDFLKMNTGSSGLILEGMPGVGKSTIIQKYLESLAIPYDTLHATSQSEAITLLHNAFHNGKTVIIDELNTMPFLEYILNALMMGEDLNGQKATNPGFRVIATQNPITFGGRYALSPALQNRFLKVNLKDYSFTDLMSIAKHKGAPEEEAFKITREFDEATKYATKHNLNPAPTPRDFIAKLSLFASRQTREADLPEEKNEAGQDETHSNKKARLEAPQPTLTP